MIEIPVVGLPRLPWTSLLVVAVGTFLAASIASRAFGHSTTRPPAPPVQQEPAPVPVAVSIPQAEQAPAEPERVFVDAPLFDVNRREMKVFTLPLDGELDDDLADEVAHFMRCRRTGRQHIMDTGVLAMLADLAHQYPGHVIEIVSAYRARPYTSPQNRHRRGRAIDLRVRNVRLRDVRDYLWTTHTDEVGIGYYPHANFIHMDHRPQHKAIAWTQKRLNGPLHYHPWWAVKLRREAAKQHVSKLTTPVPSRNEVTPAA